MGFLEIGFVDIIDIVSVAVLVYYVYRMARGTNAPSIITGIVIIYILWIVTRMLGNVIGVGVLALIVVFQPEIRQFLQTIGLRQRGKRGSSLWRKFFGWSEVGDKKIDLDPIVRAAIDMACVKTGALMVLQQETDLEFIAETGIAVDAQTSSPLIENIFFKNAPLHDGAVIIVENRIVAAKCVLPSTRSRVPKNYGMRHRAALGMSEISDAIIVVVSEETGHISVARGGEIRRNIPHDNLNAYLLSELDKKP